jgi:tellurite resistance protein TerC
MSLAFTHSGWKKFRRGCRFPGVSPRIKRFMIGVLGGGIMAIGVAMIILPGPAFIVIPLGLAVLATEFNWARRWFRKARDLLKRAKRCAKLKGYGIG